MSTVLGVDAGLRACGGALADASTGRLLAAWLSRNTVKEDDGIEAWVAMARSVAADLLAEQQRLGLHAPPALVVVEKQWINLAGSRFGKRTLNPNQILNLTGVVGALGVAVPSQRQHVITPASWKAAVLPGKWRSDAGQDREEAKEAVIKRLWSLLGEDERAAVPGPPEVPDSLRHNVLDAVGVAKWAARRFRSIMAAPRT